MAGHRSHYLATLHFPHTDRFIVRCADQLTGDELQRAHFERVTLERFQALAARPLPYFNCPIVWSTKHIYIRNTEINTTRASVIIKKKRQQFTNLAKRSHEMALSERTKSVWPWSVRMHSPLSVNHSLIVLSPDPLASLLRATCSSENTASVWPS